MNNWHDIPGYKGSYQFNIKTFEVKSLKRSYRTKDKILKTAHDQRGYLCVVLFRQGISRRTFRIHRLSAYFKYGYWSTRQLQVNHKDGIKTNNNPENLEYITIQENIKHAIENNLCSSIGENNNNVKLNEQKVRIIKWLLKNSDMLQREIAPFFRTTNENISAINCRRSWDYVKYEKEI